jgi:hypothetical protein
VQHFLLLPDPLLQTRGQAGLHFGPAVQVGQPRRFHHAKHTPQESADQGRAFRVPALPVAHKDIHHQTQRVLPVLFEGAQAFEQTHAFGKSCA